MAQDDNNGRQTEKTTVAQAAPARDETPNRSESEQGHHADDRQWTLQRIEGVIGSIA